MPHFHLGALAGGRKNFHAAVVLHPTLYDGCVEIASVRAGFSVLSSSGQPTNHNCGKEIVKTHLLEVGLFERLFNVLWVI